jgi:cytochrome P450
MAERLPPFPSPEAGKAALKTLLKEKSLLPALSALQGELGEIFCLPAPGFRPIVFAGPKANHFLLVEVRDKVLWRSEPDPVVKLLRAGVLVQDGPQHDDLRKLMSPALHRLEVHQYVLDFVEQTDRICQNWMDGQQLDMLVEMRRAALLIFSKTLFGEDMLPDLDRLFPDILKLIRFIGPGAWLIWPNAPRPGYSGPIRRMDGYLHQLIARRRQNLSSEDLVNRLVKAGLDDDLIRDQLLTMLIAGHDTSTALLAWALYLLGSHPEAMRKAQAEVDRVLAGREPAVKHLEELVFLDQVISETLRMYPPIHAGNRLAAEDLEFDDYCIPAGSRLLLSIYATHHDPKLWPEPDRFLPERFSVRKQPQPYAYLPFGGGPRNCIGAAFARVEGRIVLARLLQRFDFSLVSRKVRLGMGATLEPKPGVFMQVRRRR